jgi:hypothetical protein
VLPNLPTWKGPLRVVFANQHGPFVGIGDKKDGWTVHDLRTGKQVGKADPGLISSTGVLSQDGTRLAGIDKFGDSPNTMVVVDTSTGKLLCRLPVRPPVYHFCFVGRDLIAEMLVAGVPGGNKDEGLAYLDLKSGAEGQLIRASFQVGPVASPGGRYVAFASFKWVYIMSASNGAVLARIAIPQASHADPPGAERSRQYVAHDLAFSPDGSRLGAVFSHAEGLRLEWWRLDTGESGGRFRVEGLKDQAGILRWAVDGSALLVCNKTVVDPKTGNVLWTLPERSYYPKGGPLLLTAEHAVATERIPQTKSDRRLTLLTRP